MRATDYILKGPEVPLCTDTMLLEKITRNFSSSYRHNTAIVCGGRSISYGELERFAFLVRDELVAAGAVRGQLIGIVTGGSHSMIAAMLGVWAAGCAFAPLAADGPASKRANALEQINSSLVLVDTPDDVVSDFDCIVLSDVLANNNKPSNTNALPTIPGSVAYGFFTSGSTGTPKCCLNAHFGLNNRAEAMSRHFDLQADQAVLQNSSFIFDSSLWQIFWPLSIGSTVVIPARSSILDFNSTLSEIQAHNAVMTDFVPTILEQLVESARKDSDLREKMSHVRFVLVGGEAVTIELLNSFSDVFPHIQLVNTYGPTETSIGVVFHHFSGTEEKVPLGLPIDNTALCIVDDELNPVPLGETGEIVIGGHCMGLGYMNNPEKTSEVFISDSTLDLGSELVYKTGDLGHIEEDGLLYFDGRKDDQVKINGVRLELGDVEHHLRNEPGITWCKVTKVSSDIGSWLAAFVTADCTVCPAEIKFSLSAQLDSASIPSQIIQIDDIPTTASGKVDTKVLIANHCTNSASSTATNKLQGVEAQVWAACSRLLPGRNISLDDDLVSLGLDSIGALTLSLKLDEILNRPFSLQDLMRAPSIRSICSGVCPEQVSTTSKDILADVEQYSSCRVKLSTRKPNDGILLTGATGYVGSNILLYLLKSTNQPVTCLVRGKSSEQARGRVIDALPWLKPSVLQRIKVVVADLNDSSINFDSLDAPAVVIHSAADVNFSKSYCQLRKVNVEITAQLCAFSMACGARFVHISSVAALANGKNLPLSGTNCLPKLKASSRLPDTGYGQSKLASEHVVDAFRTQGLAADILRLGEMMPDLDVPDINSKSAFAILCSAANQVGCYPKLNEVIDYTPMGLVAQLIADLSKQTNRPCQTLNLVNTNAVDTDTLFQAVLPDKKPVSLHRFCQVLRESNGSDDQVRASMLLDLSNGADNSALFHSPELLHGLAELDDDTINWPSTDLILLEEMLEKFRMSLDPSEIELTEILEA